MSLNLRTETGSNGRDFMYKIGIQVLAYHGTNIFEAKILSRRIKKNIVEYKIHYDGWNKRWDEWIDQRRLMPNNEKNRLTMNLLKAKKQNTGMFDNDKDSLMIQNRKRTRDLSNQNHIHSNSVPSKRRKTGSKQTSNEMRNMDIENDNKMDDSHEHKTLQIKLPIALKKQLIYDWERITKHGILLKLPKSAIDECRVCDILKEFAQTAISNGDNKLIVTEIVHGISDFFDQALPITLLYRAEKEQLRNMRANGAYAQLKHCELYGAEHLSRLFVKLPTLLRANELDCETMQLLSVTIQNLIRYLVCNADRYFIKGQ